VEPLPEDPLPPDDDPPELEPVELLDELEPELDELAPATFTGGARAAG
jgi:hypothetical protein